MGTYYFEITPNIETWEVEAGSVLCVYDEGRHGTKISRLTSYSEKVWYQNDKGMVMVIKDRYFESNYPVTEEDLKQFMWIKLKAKELRYG